MTDLNCDGGVCRTAPVTQGLLMTKDWFKLTINVHTFGKIMNVKSKWIQKGPSVSSLNVNLLLNPSQAQLVNLSSFQAQAQPCSDIPNLFSLCHAPILSLSHSTTEWLLEKGGWLMTTYKIGKLQ